MVRATRPRAEGPHPWADAPVGELSDPLLPRWFVLLAIGTIVVAVATTLVAVVGFRRDEVTVEARRPPPGGGLTHAVGEHVVGDAPPVPYEAPCPLLDGVHIAGSESDRALLRQALAGLCNVDLTPEAEEALGDFARSGGVVRFALFEAAGVDSAAALGAEPPRILVNARFEQFARPRWIAPLIAHDAAVLAGDPAAADTALRARRVEAQVCMRLLGTEDLSQGCHDAEELLAMTDPLAALRGAGYR